MKVSIFQKFLSIFLIIVLIALANYNLFAQTNKAFQYNGTNQWVEIPESSNLDISNQLTVSVWVKTEDNTTAKIIEKETWNSGWTMGQDKWNGWKISIVTVNSSYGINWGEGVPDYDRWYHVAMTYDGSILKLYVDGKLKSSVFATGSIKLNNEPVSVGSDEGGQKFFYGCIDEARIWNTARSETEINDWMNKTENLSNESGLVSVWHFNESTVGTASVVDSKSTNNGTPKNLSNSDCITSTAPIGNYSQIATGNSNIAETTDVPVDLNWDNFPGVNAVFSTIQYNESPAVTTNLLPFKADKYWEIWIEEDNGSFQSDVKFHYDDITGIGDESELKLYTRSQAGEAWSEVANYSIVSNDGGSSPNTDGIGYIEAQDLAGFSQFIITSSDGDNGTLPVELIDFTAECKDKNKVELNWSTASEINNSHFEIQQSFDAKDFKTIGRVEGAGNSNTTLNYSLIVENLNAFTTYYRLKQIDFDGQFSYSEIVATSCYKSEINNIEIYPNPFKNSISINFNDSFDGKKRIQIRNIMGATIKDVFIDENTSNYSLEFNSDLSQGIYFVIISNESETIVKKVINE